VYSSVSVVPGCSAAQPSSPTRKSNVGAAVSPPTCIYTRRLYFICISLPRTAYVHRVINC
jgi:hypothetical protein